MDRPSPPPQLDQPPNRLIQIDVTVTLPRRLVWLLTGIAVGNLGLPDRLLETAAFLLKALNQSE
ncbi:hypothetical protein Rhe02_75240 [Rhizocola hellebori]|uniref:Uncharacterized protein n=1 Tax=Rhizocola hellebori TaxID=1392758 RepID=A0A8J3QH04_9ACTN|nr:hypothetical protein [Rhizocola hellebori]GIH09457.1 hypothetical protein Rhe02_75240 [Rhizocola hellebori]